MRMNEQYVSQFIKFRHSVYKREYPSIVLKEHFLLGKKGLSFLQIIVGRVQLLMWIKLLASQKNDDVSLLADKPTNSTTTWAYIY